jgi:uncharacterized membrane protein
MSDGKRPGGLTALAVLNFVFGGFVAIALLGVFAALAALDRVSDGQATVEVTSRPGAAMLWVSILLLLASGTLLIASGVGYLGQKRFLGRTLGNGYAVVSLISTVIGIITSGMTIWTIVFAIYPVLTLALLNTTFKDDLVN